MRPQALRGPRESFYVPRSEWLTGGLAARGHAGANPLHPSKSSSSTTGRASDAEGRQVMLGYLREMFLFDDWANREALRSLQEMEHPPERARKVMAHIVAAELLWMARLQQAKQETAVWPEFGLQDCERQIAELRQTWEQYLAELADTDLDIEIPYTKFQGRALQQRGARHPDARADARRVSPGPDCGGGAGPRRRARVHRLHRGGEERQADGGEFGILV